jgi:hypothetical protein
MKTRTAFGRRQERERYCGGKECSEESKGSDEAHFAGGKECKNERERKGSSVSENQT